MICDICKNLIDGNKVIVPIKKPLFFCKNCFENQDNDFKEALIKIVDFDVNL